MNKAAIRARIEQTIVQEINATNLISQNEPEVYIPRFVQTLTDRLHELVIDELIYGRK